MAKQKSLNRLSKVGANVNAHAGNDEALVAIPSPIGPRRCLSAAEQGVATAVATLLKAGAKANAVDREAMTPLHYAARSYRPAKTVIGAVELLRSGAAVNAKDARERPHWIWR